MLMALLFRLIVILFGVLDRKGLLRCAVCAHAAGRVDPKQENYDAGILL